MIQIGITWDFISPSMKTVSGIVKVNYVQGGCPGKKWKLLCEFRVRVEPGSVGYKSLNDKGIPSIVLDSIKPQLDVMVRSYQQGVIMDKSDFAWVIDTELDEAREKLKELKSINNDID